MVKLKYFVFESDTQDTGAGVDEISLQFQRNELLRNPYSRLTQFAANSQCIVMYITRSSAASEIAPVVARILSKTTFQDYVFVVCTEFDAQLAPKAAVLCEITRNDGHWALQGH